MKNLRLILLLTFLLTWCGHTYGQVKGTADSLVKQGVVLHDAGKFAEAVEKYKEALKLEPENSNALYEIGFTLFSSQKGPEAIPYLEKVVKLVPSGGNAYDLLGSIYDDIDQPEKAIEYYLKGIQVEPGYQRIYYNIAIAYYRQGKSSETERYITNAIKLDPSHASSQRIYALATYAQNKMGRSLLAWSSFLLLEPQGQRSVEAMKYVKNIVNKGITVTGPKSVTISISDKSLATPELTMTTAVLAATMDKKDLSAVDSLTLQLKSLFSIAHSITDDKKDSFISRYYSDYFTALANSEHMPAFARVMTYSIYTDENKKWFTEHENDLKALDTWVRTTKREL